MLRKVLVAGLLGGLVLIVWAFVVNGLFGFQARIDMKRLPAEREVYEALKANVPAPGRYTCNPALTSDGRFPDGEPVFGVLYGGVGHEDAGREMWIGLVLFLAAPLIGAWLLSQASPRVLSSYTRKVLFFAAIGVIVALVADLTRFGIGSYPAGDAALIALNRVVVWTLAGLVVASLIKPARAGAPGE